MTSDGQPQPIFRNQYLITDARPSAPVLAAANCINFGKWLVYLFAPLRAAHIVSVGFEALLIGVAVDPQRPADSLQEILDRSFQTAPDTAEAGCLRVNHLTGRFILLTRIAEQLTISGDACHLRQILFGNIEGVQCASSSEKLLLLHAGADLRVSADKQRFMKSPLFMRNENAWVGSSAHDDRISRLLPNHCLSLPAGQIRRLPLSVPTSNRGEAEVIDFAASALHGVFAALTKNNRLIQPITAGLDSRLLLAASLPFKDQIDYYIFVRPDSPGTTQDAAVAQVLADRLKLNFKVITPQTVTADFKRQLAAEQLFPRHLPKIENTQYHFHRPDRDTVININGNATEICRSYYGRERGQPSFARVSHFLGYSPNDAFVNQALAPWYADAINTARESGVCLTDLLYWEQRMGNWGAVTPFEQDIAIEEVAPFNNKQLLLRLLTIPSKQRCGPDFNFFLRFLARMSPDAAAVPINPQVSRYRKYISGSSTATYLGKLLVHTLAERSARVN